MSAIACPHSGEHTGQQVCRHLWSGRADSYAQRFTGTALEYDLLCILCAERDVRVPGDLVTVCAACFDAAAERATWVRGGRAVVSRPAVAERPTRLSFSH